MSRKSTSISHPYAMSGLVVLGIIILPLGLIMLIKLCVDVFRNGTDWEKKCILWLIGIILFTVFWLFLCVQFSNWTVETTGVHSWQRSGIYDVD